MKAGAPDLAGLRRFVDREDRSAPACFAGRQALIDRIGSKLGVVMTEAGKPDRDASGLTQLIQGAPGAGKTALLDEIAKRFRTAHAQRRPGDAQVPVPVMLDRDALYSEEETVLAIVEAMAGSPGWMVGPSDFRRTSMRGAGGGLRLPPILSAAVRLGSSVAPEPASFEALRRRQPPATWARAVCLMVDEIQAVDPAAGEVLNRLHTGMRGLPVLTVLAGLGDSEHSLSGSAGLSRLAAEAIHDIGCLEPEEAEAVVLGTLDVFHVDIEGGNAEGWAVRLAEESDRWPQHLHNGIRALAEDLIDAGGRLAGVDAGSVLDRGAELRRTSYRRRVSPEMEGARCLTGAVMHEIAAGAERAAVLGSIDRHSVRTEGSEPRLWRLPDGMTAPAFLGHLVHRGALQQGEDRLFRCPIPSFRDYLIEQGCDPDAIVKNGKDSQLEPTPFDYT